MWIEELDVQDWKAYVDYQNEWHEYITNYQARLEEIPLEEIEKFLKKKKQGKIEVQIK